MTPEAPTGPLMLASDAGATAASARRVLHVGDSMAPLVGYYLRPVFARSGATYVVLAEDSSSTLSWDNSRKLQEAVYEHEPDLVIVSLGSNELFEPTPARRRGAVRRLVEDVRGRACLWIGPPAWKKDLGFVDMLRANLGHCRYFDSTALRLPRMDDGRHPTWTGGHRWASAVWRDLGGSGAVPANSPPPAVGPTASPPLRQ